MALHLFDEKKPPQDPDIAERVLETAHDRAEKIIENAVKKSEEILKEMDSFRDDMKQEMKAIFKQSSESFVHTITEQSKEFATASNELIPQIKEKYISNADASLEKFNAELSKELIPIREVVDTKVQEVITTLKNRIDEEWVSAEKEIAEFKEQRKKEFADKLQERLDELAKKSFGKSLTATQHQQLVMNALEKAKQEGVFNTENE